MYHVLLYTKVDAILTSTIWIMKLVKVGKALVPTWDSASMFEFSNRTSIVGRSIPTLHDISLGEEPSVSVFWSKTPSLESRRWNESGSLTYQFVPWAWAKTSHCPPQQFSPVFQVKFSFLATQVSVHQSHTSPSDEVSKAFLKRATVGSFWMAAHLRSSSSSSWWKEIEKIFASLCLQMDELPIRKLPPPCMPPVTRQKKKRKEVSKP